MGKRRSGRARRRQAKDIASHSSSSGLMRQGLGALHPQYNQSTGLYGIGNPMYSANALIQQAMARRAMMQQRLGQVLTNPYTMLSMINRLNTKLDDSKKDASITTTLLGGDETLTEPSALDSSTYQSIMA